MPDLDTQIREYFDATSSAVSVDEVVEAAEGWTAVRPVGGVLPARPGHRGWLVGIAAAVLVVLLLGLLPLLLGPSDGPVVTTPDPPTTTSLPSTATTTQAESVATTIVTMDVVASVVPGLGTLRWERVSGDEDTLPQAFNVERDTGGGFISYEGTQVWRSDDGVAWSTEEIAAELRGYQWVFVQDGWASGSNGQAGDPRLYRDAGGSWVPVELEEPRLPEISGLEWWRWFGLPLESDGVTLVQATARAEVPWGEAYGMFEFDCGASEPCEQGPRGMWDAPSETLRLHHPANGSVLAVLTMTVQDDTLTFTDVTTGATVHSVTGTERYPASLIAERLTSGGGISHAGGWVSHQDGAFVWVEFPWDDAEVRTVPAGGFAAFEFVWDWHSPTTPLVSTSVWTSPDGIEWTNRGEPPFADPEAQWISIKQGLHELWASVVTGYEGTESASGAELAFDWTSTDGVTWTQIVSPFPRLHSREFETDFGFVATAMPQSTHLFWVSTDRATWHQVEGPPGSHEPDGAGYSGSSAAGDLLFVSVGDDAGARTLWIGRFDSAP